MPRRTRPRAEDCPAETAKSGKAQRDAAAKAHKADFLAHYREVGYRKACDAVGISHGLPTYWRKTDSEFALKYEDAQSYNIERMEHLVDAAIDGDVDMNTVQAQLVKWRLGALKPERYRERVSVEQSGPGGGPIQIENGDKTRGMELLDRWRGDRWDD